MVHAKFREIWFLMHWLLYSGSVITKKAVGKNNADFAGWSHRYHRWRRWQSLVVTTLWCNLYASESQLSNSSNERRCILVEVCSKESIVARYDELLIFLSSPSWENLQTLRLFVFRMVNPKYNKRKWREREQTISLRDMHADYRTIAKEEARSARIGLIEDLHEATKGKSEAL